MTRQAEAGLGVTVGASMAVMAAFVGEQHWLVKLMLLLAFADVLVAMLAAAGERRLSVDQAFKGATQKAISLVMVGVGVVINQQIGSALPIVEGIAGYYAAREGLSLLRNAEKAGVPTPAFLKDRFAALAPREQSDSPPRAA